jgi:hypothetical protein
MGEAPGDDWIKTGLTVFGALGALVGILTFLTSDFLVLLAFLAGGGWLLSIPLMVIIRRNGYERAALRQELTTLRENSETDTRDLRQQITEWRTIAMQDSESLNRFVARAIEMPHVVPRRAPNQDIPPAAAGIQEAVE